MLSGTGSDPTSSLIAKVANGYGVDLEVRLAILGFRDRRDGVHQFIEPKTAAGKNFFDLVERDGQGEFKRDLGTKGLVPNKSRVEELFNKLQGHGGDDWCEDVPAALKRAVDWGDWQGDARFLLLVTDAPCHGSEFNNGEHDDYPQESASSREQMKAAMEKAVDQNISILHCSLDSKATQRMSSEMQKQAEAAERTHAKGAAALARKTPKSTQGKIDEAVKISTEKRFAEIKLPQSVGGPVQDKPHIIFCNDDSGSMSSTDMPGRESRWTALVKAFNNVWNYLAKSQSANELCSVMNHDHTSRTILECKRFCGAPPTEVNHANFGGNCFDAAARHTVGMVSRQPEGYNPIIIFMSDGGCGDYEAAKQTFNTLRSKFPKMQVHTVAFSPGAQERPLKVIADKEDYFHKAITGEELAREFTSIVSSVSDSKVATHVYEKVAEELAKQIDTKLMNDCL